MNQEVQAIELAASAKHWRDKLQPLEDLENRLQLAIKALTKVKYTGTNVQSEIAEACLEKIVCGVSSSGG